MTDFLYEPVTGVEIKLKQSILKPITGVEWFVRTILKEITGGVVDLSLELDGVAEWEEWEPAQSKSRNWSSKEERRLWAVLDELDKADHKAMMLKQKKEKAQVARARAKMGVGKEQPSILESIQARSSKTMPAKEGGGGVITLTGSVEVAAPQSNTVTQRASP